jgi:hypothetical protein
MLVVMPDKLPHPGTLAPWLHAASWSASWHPGILAPSSPPLDLTAPPPAPATTKTSNQRPPTVDPVFSTTDPRPGPAANPKKRTTPPALAALSSVVGSTVVHGWSSLVGGLSSI